MCLSYISSLVFFNDTSTTEIYTLSLHDALPIFDPVRPVLGLFPGSRAQEVKRLWPAFRDAAARVLAARPDVKRRPRSEEHTSELQSLTNLVCRLLLEKKKDKTKTVIILTPIYQA